MSTESPADPHHPAATVFLSYASSDRQAAQSLRDALPGYGLEVWYDESGLTGGDAWDQKIRRQIRECDFFMPLISAQTEVRAEGYFRREWRLAVERTLDMADDHTFLLPIVIDDTREADARVPERFLTVQWTRVPGGKPNAALEALCRRLVAGESAPPPPARQAQERPGRRGRSAPNRELPPIPQQQAGEKAQYWLRVAGWLLQSAWVLFRRLPGWVRILIYAWLFVVVLSRGCMPSDRHADRISSADAQRIKEIAANYKGSSNEADVAKLGAQIAREFSNRAATKLAARTPLLAVPFSAPSDDAAAQKVADATFAETYGRVAVSHHGQVGLIDKPIPELDAAAAADLGRARHSRYVVFGAIDKQSTPQSLAVKILNVENGSIAWSESYPVVGAEPTKIATAVDAKLQSLEEDD
jgi:TolB-like protein